MNSATQTTVVEMLNSSTMIVIRCGTCGHVHANGHYDMAVPEHIDCAACNGPWKDTASMARRVAEFSAELAARHNHKRFYTSRGDIIRAA